MRSATLSALPRGLRSPSCFTRASVQDVHGTVSDLQKVDVAGDDARSDRAPRSALCEPVTAIAPISPGPICEFESTRTTWMPELPGTLRCFSSTVVFVSFLSGSLTAPEATRQKRPHGNPQTPPYRSLAHVITVCHPCHAPVLPTPAFDLRLN